MRILSQDGTIDLPYERVGISVRDIEIIAYPMEEKDSFWTMAIYRTKEQVEKAMDILRDSYMAHETYKTMTAEQKTLLLVGASKNEEQNLYGVFRFPMGNEMKE